MKWMSAGFCALLALACSSAPPPPPPVPPAAVPASAVDVMCSRLHTEGINSELRAVKMTQPLITPQTVQGLAEAVYYSGRSAPRIAAAATVPVETAGTCVTHTIDAITPHENDVMILEFSSPFENPFVRGQLGCFARLSLGTEAASWYWVPIGLHGGTWGAATPIMLPIRD